MTRRRRVGRQRDALGDESWVVAGRRPPELNNDARPKRNNLSTSAVEAQR